MARKTTKTSRPKAKRGRRTGPDCKMLRAPVTSIGEFFNTCSGLMKKDGEFWFRGHANLDWRLTPSALRYDPPGQRQAALRLLSDFRRYAAIKLPNPPSRDDELQWVQLAQHYGLPTRLLDWTRNAAIALYFACVGDPRSANDGAVVILNPKDLNRKAKGENRIFDAHSDAKMIVEYFPPSGNAQSSLKTVAINPVYNSERIMLQQGVFTLHGPKEPTLTSTHVPSLVCLRVPHAHKQQLLQELEHVGINEMSIFPEPEHMCRYLVWREKLNTSGVS